MRDGGKEGGEIETERGNNGAGDKAGVLGNCLGNIMNERRPDGRGNRLYLLVLPTPSAPPPPPHYLRPLSLRLTLSPLPLLRRSLPHRSLLQTCISSPHLSFFLPLLSAAFPIPPPTTRADGWILFTQTCSSRPSRRTIRMNNVE